MTPQTLIGVWPVLGTEKAADAHRQALVKLARLCGDNDVLPCGDSAFATIEDRTDAIWAAHDLHVQVPYLLNLCEKVGFKRGRMLVAASVPVRYSWEPAPELDCSQDTSGVLAPVVPIRDNKASTKNGSAVGFGPERRSLTTSRGG